MGSSASSRPPSVIGVTPGPSSRASSAVKSASPSKQAARDEKKGTKDEKKAKEDANSKLVSTQSSTGPKDVMISYSHQDSEAMLKLRGSLEKAGISVWVDVTGLKAGVDFLSKIGQAIIDARCFISLLSESTIKSKYCQDELALAYVSSKPIFPCGLKQADHLFPLMDTGMKLQLARFAWTMIETEEQYEQSLKDLITAITETKTPEEEPEVKPKTERPEFKRQKSSLPRFNKRANRRSTFMVKMEKANENLSEERMMKFWERNFKNEQVIAWEQFTETFEKDYREPLQMIYSKQDKEWLIGILARELQVEENHGHCIKAAYIEFCTVEDELQPFWTRVQDQAVESYTMKEVFDMDSSVRVEAIENLGKFHSQAVVEALMDLLTDSDNNVRAVAAISLARTGASTPDIIKRLMKTLDDKDRLVRESGCLALGHLKAKAAVSKIVHLWRNDFISHVREAAQVALEQIGGEEANKAMHMTKVLSEEIRMLTNE